MSKINFHGWVGVGGWLEKLGIRLSQLKLTLSLAIVKVGDQKYIEKLMVNLSVSESVRLWNV